jgi:hypothetical protein
VSFRPQEGSLAAALGMAHDPRSIYLPVRMASDSPTGSNAPLTKKTLFDAAVQNMVSSSRGAKQVTNKETVEVLAQEGSLASDLGMAVYPSPKATPVRQISVKPLLRLERMKANAIKSANRDFGIDEYFNDALNHLVIRVVRFRKLLRTVAPVVGTVAQVVIIRQRLSVGYCYAI